MNELNLTPWLITWVVTMAVVLLILSLRRVHTGGLIVAYFLSTAVNYFFGAAIHALPWLDRLEYIYVYRGFVLTTWGMVAFAAGCLIFLLASRIWLERRFRSTTKYIPEEKLPLTYFFIGVLIYFIIYPLIQSIPSVGLLGHSGWFLMIAGICLAAADAWRQRQSGKLIRWIILALFFPFITVVSQGFMSFGMVAVITVLAFVSSFYRPKWKILVAGAIFMYLGLSLYVTYFRDRTEIRETVWQEETPMVEKVTKFANTLKNYELFDVYNVRHLDFIDMRLNQNILVGKSVEFIDSGQERFAYGQTYLDALLALVPRLFWPDKPMSTGGSELVSRYTGEAFSELTTVGIGQTMEFYINFGFWGVIVGYFILGVVIAFFDSMTGFWLQKGEYKKCVFWLLSGMALLQAADSLVEMAGTMAASIFFMIMINQFVLSRISPQLVSIRALIDRTQRRKAL